MNSHDFPSTQTPVVMGIIIALVAAAAILSLPVGLLEHWVAASGLPALWPEAVAPLGNMTRALLALGGGLVSGICTWILLGFLLRDANAHDDYDLFRDDLPILRPIFASTDLGAPFDSINIGDRILPFENHPVAEGDAPVMSEPGRMLWEPDPWFDDMQDPEPALLEPARWGAPVLAAQPIASLSLAELVARLEAGMRRRRAMAAAAPIPARTNAFSPVRDMDDALRDALGTLQRLAARSA